MFGYKEATNISGIVIAKDLDVVITSLNSIDCDINNHVTTYIRNRINNRNLHVSVTASARVGKQLNTKVATAVNIVILNQITISSSISNLNTIITIKGNNIICYSIIKRKSCYADTISVVTKICSSCRVCANVVIRDSIVIRGSVNQNTNIVECNCITRSSSKLCDPYANTIRIISEGNTRSAIAKVSIRAISTDEVIVNKVGRGIIKSDASTSISRNDIIADNIITTVNNHDDALSIW